MRLDYLILIGLAPPLLYLGARTFSPAILPPVPIPSPASSTPFDPIDFFEGNTQGSGTLYELDGDSRDLNVASVGRRLPDGGLEITQTIALEGSPERTRTWTIQPEEGARYSGTLTDAKSGVVAMTGGRRMVIAYESDGHNIRQTLTQIDPNTVRNRLDVYKWGINVARLDETITRS